MPKDRKTSTRAKRWLELVRLLKNHRSGMSFNEIYDSGLYRELDKKTFERDIEDLKKHFGVEISRDPKTKHYRLEKESSFFFSLEFTEQETEALALGLKMIAHFLPHMNSSALNIWEKLQKYIPLESGRNSEALSQFTQILGEAPKINAGTFSTLTEAIRVKINVNILYKESEQPAKRFTVSPKSICFKDGAWFLEAAAVTTGRISLYTISCIRNVTADEDE